MSGLLVGSALALIPSTAIAQDTGAEDAVSEGEGNAIVVTGIRSSLQSALNEKRNADSLIEVIQAEDIGKLPDQNLAEVLENVTGVQITRTAGVGTGVQIRGTSANRVEINGVGTLGSGSGRGGINFEDVNAAIIGSVEVIKAPTADTIEGSVGGTINLRTIRPLDINDRILTVRAQGEYSELSETVTPRIAASFGNRWDVGDGEFGVVLAGSYTKQEATSLRPRVDRDGGLVENVNADVIRGGNLQDPADRPSAQDFDFVGVQFLNQERENFEFTTINIAGSLEYAPNSDLKFFIDGFYNDQERRQDSSRVQGSGVSNLLDFAVPATFDTVNFGALDGVQLGSIQVATSGVIPVNLAADPDDPNLRFSSDTGARVTENSLFRAGFEWQADKLSVRAEVSTTSSDTVNPNFSTTVNFINPNAPLNALDANGNPTSSTLNENAVPFIYDLRGNSLTFGIDFASPFAPTVADLLNPNNVAFEALQIGRDTTENSEDAFRLDLSYDTSDFVSFITSVDTGYRYSKTSSAFQDVNFSRSFGRLLDVPTGEFFADLLVPGPDNFDSFDGRELAVNNFLVIDPDRAFSDPDGTLAILQQAFVDSGANGSIGDAVASDQGFFDIDEKTHAFYAQANFEFGAIRGNVGFRYIDTSIDSLGNNVDSVTGAVTQVVTSGSYSQFLPRINLIADVTDDLVFRASFGEDVNRPSFTDLSTSVTFGTSENAAVRFGNPGLAPETVQSFDASIDWYFAPAAVLSIGVFHKDRSNLFVEQLEDVALDANGFADITDPCEGGGIFNPIAQRNTLSDQVGQGICVPIITQVNDTDNTTQTGIEVAFQYDLARFEDTLGFASGFGILANYTYQDFGGGDAVNTSASRGTDIFNAINGIYDDANFVPVTAAQGLLDFSKNAYNVTLFYEKYGISARARYTWRDAFRTLDTAAGASLNSTLGFPVVTAARGQLNGSITYDLTENIVLGVEGVNLTKSNIQQFCVNDDALLCFEGLPDRRLTFGATVRF
ncbi:TonB-dependent receptor [Erythrobacter longus]|uniref:TonB-dependent receptor n=2 Tax=Erythrobacter longus TaxID=1044 RepID=A0A074M6H4_ERYLO|nr:TonB-dependent receptor [Erythrobacter longus]